MQTSLHRCVISKNFSALELELLKTTEPQIMQELNAEGDSFKTLAVKTLTASEFQDFCNVLKKFYTTPH